MTAEGEERHGFLRLVEGEAGSLILVLDKDHVPIGFLLDDQESDLGEDSSR